MKTPAIQIDHLSYSYKSHWSWRKTPGLMDLCLTVEQGESFGFLGHNGAGKTTTIKCLLNLIQPESGLLKIFGADALKVESHRAVGYVPEQPYFYDHLTVHEALNMYAALAGVEHRRIKEAVAKVLAKLKLETRAGARLRSLSKGLMQRVAMAQALVGAPRLLVLDEPFSGLDPIGRKEFAELLFEEKRRGTTIFMSSHILSDVEFLCDRVSIMAHGKLKGVFSLKEIAASISGHYELVVRDYADVRAELEALSLESSAQDLFLRLSFKDKDLAEKALARAIQGGASVESFQLIHGGLEELFIKLVKPEDGSIAGIYQ